MWVYRCACMRAVEVHVLYRVETQEKQKKKKKRGVSAVATRETVMSVQQTVRHNRRDIRNGGERERERGNRGEQFKKVRKAIALTDFFQRRS